jgi:hypothetical protein
MPSWTRGETTRDPRAESILEPNVSPKDTARHRVPVPEGAEVGQVL